MFDERSAEVARLAGSCAVEACWAQWSSLGSPASKRATAARAIVDPEALVVLSLVVARRERRLRDLVAWWARVGSALTSVQRFRSVAARFPGDEGRRALGWFAARAAAEGDRRWSRHATDGADAATARDKGADSPRLGQPCALLLRLRAGFGVGAKADTLGFLLGSEGAWASATRIAYATRYSSVAIRNAVSEMALAGFVREASDAATAYSVAAADWAPLLGLHGASAFPRWYHWPEVFGFLAGALDWADAAAAPGAPGEHVLASRARDLLEKHARAFELDGVRLPRPAQLSGLEAVDGLRDGVRTVARWLEASI
jgi:hypothetical protein